MGLSANPLKALDQIPPVVERGTAFSKVPKFISTALKDCLRKFEERPECFAEIERMERRRIT